MYKTLDVLFWGDKRVQKLSLSDRFIACYLLLGQVNRIGCYVLKPSLAASDVGLQQPKLMPRVASVCDHMGWGWDPEASVVYLPKWWKWKHAEIRSEKTFFGYLKDIEHVPPCQLVIDFCHNGQFLPRHLVEKFHKKMTHHLIRIPTLGVFAPGSGTGSGSTTTATTPAAAPPPSPPAPVRILPVKMVIGRGPMPLVLAEHRRLFLERVGHEPKYHRGNYAEATKLERTYTPDVAMGMVQRFFQAVGQWWDRDSRYDFDAFAKPATVNWLLATTNGTNGALRPRRRSIDAAWEGKESGEVVIR